jgi:putative zinc finger/helix-turn-helix YgiT family protein
MADKPFPWMCGKCGQTEVRPKAIDYKAEIKHDGKLYEVQVSSLEVPTCAHCQTQWFDAHTDDQINIALRQQIGLLQPEEIRSQRKALRLTQKDLAEKIGAAESSLSRWENGSSIQSKSTDKSLRMFFKHPNDPVWDGRDSSVSNDPELTVSAEGHTARDWELLLQEVAKHRNAFFHAGINSLELSLLGRLLLEPFQLESISKTVVASHFSNITCRHTYEAMLDCLHEHRTNTAEHFAICVRDRLRRIEPEGVRFLPLLVDHVGPADRASDIAMLLRNRAMIHQQLDPIEETHEVQ